MRVPLEFQKVKFRRPSLSCPSGATLRLVRTRRYSNHHSPSFPRLQRLLEFFLNPCPPFPLVAKAITFLRHPMRPLLVFFPGAFLISALRLVGVPDASFPPLTCFRGLFSLSQEEGNRPPRYVCPFLFPSTFFSLAYIL